jgi:ubiquinone/menaquinone biosynthesis C-methylase UbiE
MRVLDAGCGMGIFSIALARLVGPEGKVFSCDLQPQALEVLLQRAGKAGVAERIETRALDLRRLDLTGPLDFALAAYCLHEVEGEPLFFDKLIPLLRPGAYFLLIEPKVHVSYAHFARIADAAVVAGLALEGRPRVRFSHTALFRKAYHSNLKIR